MNRTIWLMTIHEEQEIQDILHGKFKYCAFTQYKQ